MPAMDEADDSDNSDIIISSSMMLLLGGAISTNMSLTRPFFRPLNSPSSSISLVGCGAGAVGSQREPRSLDPQKEFVSATL